MVQQKTLKNKKRASGKYKKIANIKVECRIRLDLYSLNCSFARCLSGPVNARAHGQNRNHQGADGG